MRKPMALPELLQSLLTAPGPSGYEDEPARIWREAASAFAEVTSDTLGTSFARVRAAEGAPTLALVGHIDEIGVTITNVEDDGLLAFTTLGEPFQAQPGRWIGAKIGLFALRAIVIVALTDVPHASLG